MPANKARFLTSGKEPVQFSTHGEVHLPKLGQYVSVPVERLKTLMNRSATNSRKTDRLESIGYALIGAGIGASVSAVCLWASVDFSKIENAVEIINWKGYILPTATPMDQA